MSNECVDKDTEACPSLAQYGHCTESSNLEWVQENCKKSCGLCCVDTDTKACPELAKYGHCTDSSNLEWVQKNCKKSCGLCNA